MGRRRRELRAAQRWGTGLPASRDHVVAGKTARSRKIPANPSLHDRQYRSHQRNPPSPARRICGNSEKRPTAQSEPGLPRQACYLAELVWIRLARISPRAARSTPPKGLSVPLPFEAMMAFRMSRWL